jgi:hypothetical protein
MLRRFRFSGEHDEIVPQNFPSAATLVLWQNSTEAGMEHRSAARIAGLSLCGIYLACMVLAAIGMS